MIVNQPEVKELERVSNIRDFYSLRLGDYVIKLLTRNELYFIINSVRRKGSVTNSYFVDFTHKYFRDLGENQFTYFI